MPQICAADFYGLNCPPYLPLQPEVYLFAASFSYILGLLLRPPKGRECDPDHLIFVEDVIHQIIEEN